MSYKPTNKNKIYKTNYILVPNNTLACCSECCFVFFDEHPMHTGQGCMLQHKSIWDIDESIQMCNKGLNHYEEKKSK